MNKIKKIMMPFCGTCLVLLAFQPTAFASTLQAQLERAIGSKRTAIDVKVGDQHLVLVGEVVFVSPPELPDFFGLRDDHNVMHILKSDPQVIEILPSSTVRPSPDLKWPVNHLLTSWEDFGKVHKDKDGAQKFLRDNGFGKLVDRDVIPLSKHENRVRALTWAFAGAGTMLYFMFMDKAGGIYLGRPGPAFIVEHFSNVVGSTFLASFGSMLGPKREPYNKIWRVFVASGATAANYAIENPEGVETLKMFASNNVQDPGDFLAGTIAAWLTAFTPETLRFADRIQGRLKGWLRSRQCERALLKEITDQ